MDMIKRVLEFDPLAQAEMAFGGKHWSEFSDDEMKASMGLAFYIMTEKISCYKNHMIHILAWIGMSLRILFLLMDSK